MEEQEIYTECPVQNALSLSSLYTFFRVRYAENFVFQGESHDFTEVVCVLDGRAGVTAGKDVFVLTPGQMIIHKDGEFHKIWSDGKETEIIIFSFNSTPLPQNISKVYSLSVEQIDALKNTLKKAKKTFQIQGKNVINILPNKEFQASLVLKELETFLLSVFTENNIEKDRLSSRSSENYMKIVSVLENNLDKNLSISDISELCNLSIPSIEQIVHKYLGKGVNNYYTVLKLKRATELLQENYSVKEISDMLCFSNPNYFSACFKKHYGKYPTQWKKEK